MFRNKCEFAIGLNPENRRLTVGFKLDPRSAAPDVGPVEHLRHVPDKMKMVAHFLERYLRSTNYKHFDYQTGTGHWVTAVVRITLRRETLIILNFVPQQLSAFELKNIKRGLRNFFEYGDGRQCDVTSLNFSEKSVSGPGSLDNLYGADTVAETLFSMEFLISARAYFCVNTAGEGTLTQRDDNCDDNRCGNPDHRGVRVSQTAQVLLTSTRDRNYAVYLLERIL